MTDLTAIQQLSVAGRHQDCLQACQNALQANQEETYAYKYAGKSLLALGQFEKAQQFLVRAHKLDGSDPEIVKDIGNIFNALQNDAEAIRLYKAALSIDANYAPAINNLGLIAKRQGNLEAAEQLVKKAIDLDQSFAPYHINLGGIYQDLGQLDQALAATLKSLELKPDNLVALNNLKGFIDQLTLNSVNAQSLTKAYELLIDLDNIDHSKLSLIFTQAFLPAIQEAAKHDPIISAENNALINLAVDWRLRKSLTLLIPPHQVIEHFLARLRKELLVLAVNQTPISEILKGLMEALAMQCFLNEYVYEQSPEEEELVKKLISRARENQEIFSQYLAIIACYVPIYQLGFNQDWSENYPTDTYESRTLIESQLKEPEEEEKIKDTIKGYSEITDAVSVKVQDMYEESPYPRYRYADFTDNSLAQYIPKAIGNESTKHKLRFPEGLVANNSRPKVLIAGCGTGYQVINASRYKNAQITAIDLSSSSLAYAIRKAREYEMVNVEFRKLDLLNVAELDEIFYVIECSGVLHHMEDPLKGLSALNQQLKPGGYIKLGLYSDIARQDIVKARERIKQLELKSSSDGIRHFRKQVLEGEFKDLSNLPKCGKDFYSLSTCRDLCFHVQEHRFTAGLLQEFLATEGLIFCGFMLPEVISKNYRQQYPADTDMTSLKNWGDFEQQHPSTFGRMYQFWAYKPS